MTENKIEPILFKKKPWPNTKKEIEWASAYIKKTYYPRTADQNRESVTHTLRCIEKEPFNRDIIKKIKAAWSREKFRSKLKKNNKVEQNLILSKPNYDELNDLAYKHDTSLDSTLKYLLEHHRKSKEDIKTAKHQLEELQGKLELLREYEKAIEELRCICDRRTEELFTAMTKKRVTSTVNIRRTKEGHRTISLEGGIKKDLQSITDKELNVFERLNELKNRL